MCLNNNLIVNTVKTVNMSFHLCQSKPPYKPNTLLQNTEITYMSESKVFRNVYHGKFKLANPYPFLSCSLSKTYYMIESLTLCRSNLNSYCLGRKAVFFSPQQQTNIPTWISMTYFDAYAWIMFIHVHICLLSDFIMSGNIELLFLLHNAIFTNRTASAFRPAGSI
jgi:hypothetical protein